MPEETAFRQMDEKHVSVEVELMLWSPKFDLVALSNVQGEVVLHRLSWQKVWSVPAPAEDVKATALSWRPDGKVLAAGYSCGKIHLYDIENAQILHSLELKGEITCMNWISHTLPEGDVWSPDPYDEDNFNLFLPKLQPLSKSYGSVTKGPPVEECVEDSKKLGDQKELNLLVAGCGSCNLHLIAYGVYPVGVLAVSSPNDLQLVSIKSATISQDLQSLVLMGEFIKEGSDDNYYYVMTYDTTLFASRHKELRLLALKCGQVATLLGYLQSTVQQMSEAWEDILMEMDSKLLYFAEEKKKKGTSTVSNDFLELLMFGTPSVELQAFLLHELTEKGLKKLGHSIETSYSNIQKLVVKHLQVVSQAILYHLAELKGMSEWFDKFGVLGMNTSSIQKAVTAVGSFVLKTSELQQVIDDSIKNFKAFFRWLYVVILRFSNEKPPAELSKMTQHDINFVAEFLRDNFAHFSLEDDDYSIEELTGNAESKPGFKLEKVGQYLKKEDLHYPPSISGNPWTQYVRGSLHIKDNQILYPVQNNKSLVQLQDVIENSIEQALSKPSLVIGESLHCLSSLQLFDVSKGDQTDTFRPRFCQFTNVLTHMMYTVYTPGSVPCDQIIILRQPTDAEGSKLKTDGVIIKVGMLLQADGSMETDSNRCGNHKILDIGCYDEKTLSVLLIEDNEDQTPVLAQLHLGTIPEEMYKVVTPGGSVIESDLGMVDVGPLIEHQCCRHLDNMKAHSFAVSGTRKTATVLFSSRRRVRIFLMDAEEEEEEEEEDDEEEEEPEETEAQSGEGDTSGVTEGDIQVRETEEPEGQENKENDSFASTSME
ncbi:hypothetical protein KUTeg_005010 [Tegillarca granosa]|uniref:Anaphase-promoting complex subunit 4 n=1 Tax=Tegillarca granosa TaxID=220873 RepID=A0ABQ9FIJ1_TEGGR|nr:hypothetical protein KUTeg_005010 [Tegillarca granosa]